MLLLKTDACQGCPAYSLGKYYVPDEYRPGAQVLVLGQNPGEEEERQGRPFVGFTGQKQDRVCLPRAGLTREEVSLANPIRCRWNGKNDLPLPTTKIVKEAITHCQRAYFRPPESTKVIVATGVYALAAMGRSGLEEHRGWAWPRTGTPNDVWCPGPRDTVVLPTYHTAYVATKAPWKEPIMLRDWAKVAKIVQGTWPLLRPVIHHYYHSAPEFHGTVAFDTEFAQDKRLLRYSVAENLTDGHVVEGAFPMSGPTAVIMQNAPVDIPYWRVVFGQDVPTDDLMLAHAVLYPDEPHTLGFIASLWSPWNAWKHLADTNAMVYSGMDALVTLACWKQIKYEFATDPLSANVYSTYMKPLPFIIEKAQRIGVAVNRDRVKSVVKHLNQTVTQARARAQAAAGWGLNVGSPIQVAHHLYQVEKVND